MGSLRTLILLSDSTYTPIFFRRHLHDHYNLYTVGAADFTIAKVSGIHVDIVVIDDKGLDEKIFSVCREWRNKAEFRDMPILVITGKLSKSYLEKLIIAGANDVLRDPLEEHAVRNKLSQAEQFRRVEQKLDLVTHNISMDTLPIDLQKERLFIDKGAIGPIYETIERGGHLCVIALSIDGSEITEHLRSSVHHFLHGQLRTGDLLYTLDSIHYVIFLNHTSIKGGSLIGERIQHALAEHDFPMHGKITLSMGIAGQKAPPYANIREMMLDAKSALMKASQVGNQIVIHPI